MCWILAITVTKERLQTLKRNVKLILSRSQPRLFNLAGSKLFLRIFMFYSKLIPGTSQPKISNFAAKTFLKLYFHFFSDFPVGIWYEVHPGQYSHNIVFYKLNVHQRRRYQRPYINGPKFVLLVQLKISIFMNGS